MAPASRSDKTTGAREVFAIVCLVHYNPRSKDGHVFGYKGMTEHMGPCEASCPTAVLDPDNTVTNDAKSYHALAFCGPVIAVDGANIHELTLRLRRQVQIQKDRP